MTRLGFHPHVIEHQVTSIYLHPFVNHHTTRSHHISSTNPLIIVVEQHHHQQPIGAAELGMDVQAWIASTSTSTSASTSTSTSTSSSTSTSTSSSTSTSTSPSPSVPGQDNIVMDDHDGRLIHSDEAIERMLRAATNANYRRLLVDRYEGSGGRSASSSPSPSPSVSTTSSPRQSPPRLLFTPRIERGAHSNPLEDVRYVLADHQTGPSSSQSPNGDKEEDRCSIFDDENDDDNDDDAVDDDQAGYVPWNQPSVLPPYILRRNHNTHNNSDSSRRYAPRIIIYQTRGVYTGGTVALALLAERLDVLGYNVLLCEDHNRLSEPCARPSSDDVGKTHDGQIDSFVG